MGMAMKSLSRRFTWWELWMMFTQNRKNWAMMAWLKAVGETDFEYLGMQIPEPTFQVVVAITRNKIHGTFSVIETSSTGKSCMVTLGNFEGSLDPNSGERPKKEL